jgi:hypothetical protein
LLNGAVLTEAVPTVTGTPPLLVNVKVRSEALLPTAVVPKVCVDGLNVTSGEVVKLTSEP